MEKALYDARQRLETQQDLSPKGSRRLTDGNEAHLKEESEVAVMVVGSPFRRDTDRTSQMQMQDAVVQSLIHLCESAAKVPYRTRACPLSPTRLPSTTIPAFAITFITPALTVIVRPSVVGRGRPRFGGRVGKGLNHPWREVDACRLHFAFDAERGDEEVRVGHGLSELVPTRSPRRQLGSKSTRQTEGETDNSGKPGILPACRSNPVFLRTRLAIS